MEEESTQPVSDLVIYFNNLITANVWIDPFTSWRKFRPNNIKNDSKNKQIMCLVSFLFPSETHSTPHIMLNI